MEDIRVRHGRPVVGVVLAAGAGTRMKSAIPKVLHPVAGRPMVGHALAALADCQPDQIVAVVRHEREQVVRYLQDTHPQVAIADQDDVAGTGRAVQCGLAALTDLPDDAAVVIVAGDTPLLTGDTITALLDAHLTSRVAGSVLTALVPDPTGYGRVLRGEAGEVIGVVEQKDATDAQRTINEINTGVYCFDAGPLQQALSRVGTDNAQGEMYLPDVLGLFRADGLAMTAHVSPDAAQTEGVNDRLQLAAANAAMNRRILTGWMRAGVGISDPATTWVDIDVVLEPDCQLLPGVQLHGQTTVATGAVIGPDSTLTNVTVGAGAQLIRTHGSDSEVGANCQVGPFTHLRPGTVLASTVKVGSFAETKQVTIGTGTKIPHLAYVGDADVGEHSNIGCGTVFVNYDGVTKARSMIGNHARIGSDTMVIAPVTVGDGAYTAAGTVLREDVPPGALALTEGRQRTIDGWVLRKREGTGPAQAAQQALSTPTEQEH